MLNRPINQPTGPIMTERSPHKSQGRGHEEIVITTALLRRRLGESLEWTHLNCRIKVGFSPRRKGTKHLGTHGTCCKRICGEQPKIPHIWGKNNCFRMTLVSARLLPWRTLRNTVRNRNITSYTVLMHCI